MNGQKRKLAVVTGTAGLGFEIAKGLAATGAEVILAGRNANVGSSAVGSIRQAHPEAMVTFRALDLASLASITDFVDGLSSLNGAVDVLVNSAGVISMKRQTTQLGAELMFGVNFLGHFALTGHLLPLLRRSASPRVVNIVGAAYRSAKINFDDLNSERKFSGMRAGGQSMLAKVLFTRELQRKSDSNGWRLSVAAADPGIARTELMNNPNTPGVLNLITSILGSLIGQSAAEGAQPALLAATSEKIVPGGYYAPSNWSGTKGLPRLKAMAPSGADPSIAGQLWEIAQQMTGHPFPDQAA